MTGYNFNRKSSLEENHRVLWLLGENKGEREERQREIERDRDRKTDRQTDRQGFGVDRTQNEGTV